MAQNNGARAGIVKIVGRPTVRDLILALLRQPMDAHVVRHENSFGQQETSKFMLVHPSFPDSDPGSQLPVIDTVNV